MAVNKKEVIPGSLPQVSSPIQHVTENGYSIIRLCEVDGSLLDTARECRFLVRDAGGWERAVTVAFDGHLIERILRQRRIRLSHASVLWLVCAEQCLAKYLRENDNFPDGARLSISELSVDELLLATHWSDQQGD